MLEWQPTLFELVDMIWCIRAVSQFGLDAQKKAVHRWVRQQPKIAVFSGTSLDLTRCICRSICIDVCMVKTNPFDWMWCKSGFPSWAQTSSLRNRFGANTSPSNARPHAATAAPRGYTSLHWAAKRGHKAVAQRLLTASGVVEAVGNDGHGLGRDSFAWKGTCFLLEPFGVWPPSNQSRILVRIEQRRCVFLFFLLAQRCSTIRVIICWGPFIHSFYPADWVWFDGQDHASHVPSEILFCIDKIRPPETLS